ncbi:hypothetical protein BC835DRAFT_1303840 [Cytidiella melzeri]|nr:hypothetical protein BC835DRAFT_1303840 [Cytidiella melzeri]
MSAAELSAFYQSVRSTNYIIYGLVALVVYEHLITVSREVRNVWSRKFSGAAVLFALNRYLLLVYILVQNVPVSTSEGCFISLRTFDTIIELQALVSAIFSALRVYAIWNRNLVFPVFIFLLNLVRTVNNIDLYAGSSIVFFILGPFDICSEQSSRSEAAQVHATLATRICVILADLLVLTVTWAKTVSTKRRAMRTGLNAPLITMLLRDGDYRLMTDELALPPLNTNGPSLAHGRAMLNLNIAQILVENVPVLAQLSPVSSFISVLIPILISRFILNLREVDHDAADDETSDMPSIFSGPVFRVARSVTGTLGGELGYDHDESVDEEGEDSAPEAAVSLAAETSCSPWVCFIGARFYRAPNMMFSGCKVAFSKLPGWRTSSDSEIASFPLESAVLGVSLRPAKLGRLSSLGRTDSTPQSHEALIDLIPEAPMHMPQSSPESPALGFNNNDKAQRHEFEIHTSAQFRQIWLRRQGSLYCSTVLAGGSASPWVAAFVFPPGTSSTCLEDRVRICP